MKPLLFTMTFLFSVSGYSFFFESDQDKFDDATELLKKSFKVLELGDIYSACKFHREANEKFYEVKSQIPKIAKETIIEANKLFSEKCKGF